MDTQDLKVDYRTSNQTHMTALRTNKTSRRTYANLKAETQPTGYQGGNTGPADVQDLKVKIKDLQADT